MEEHRGDKQIAERTEEIKRLNGECDKCQYESDNLMNEINNISTKGAKRDYKKIKDDKEIRNIIHQDLEVIWISKEEEHAVHKLEFVFKDGQTKTYILKHNGRVRKLWDEQGNEIEFEFNERVKRKRY
jgi:DNA-directed RNA polymerase subunit M/transcription elongation factor TFIIS